MAGQYQMYICTLHLTAHLLAHVLCGKNLFIFLNFLFLNILRVGLWFSDVTVILLNIYTVSENRVDTIS